MVQHGCLFASAEYESTVGEAWNFLLLALSSTFLLPLMIYSRIMSCLLPVASCEALCMMLYSAC